MSTAGRAVNTRAAYRTALGLLATGLGVIPLKTLLVDNLWLLGAWMSMLVVLLPAALLRLRRPPSALDVWPGIVLLIPWLTAMFGHEHAWLGFIPNEQTWSALSTLMQDLHRTTQDEVAPIHSTVAVRLVVCALAGLLAALIDLIAVVGRHAALAGIPLLAIYTVAGAVPRTPVAWFWFVFAAAGYLLLLGMDAGDDLRGWGRRVPRPGASPTTPTAALSGPRIGVLAMVVAVAVPLVVPIPATNLLADAVHDGGGSSLGGFGAGSGTEISPFAALKGQLTRDKAVPVMSVHVADNGSAMPFYLRSNVLSKVTEQGWQVDDHGPTTPVSGYLGTEPDQHPDIPRTEFTAKITISGLTGNAPLFAIPTEIEGVSDEAKWNPRDQILLEGRVQRGQVIQETVAQPNPDLAQLRAAPAADSPALQRWLQLPSEPRSVTAQVEALTRGLHTPYAKARAISDFFADPENGFVYSLTTEDGDSGSELADFLRYRQGYCQQYAAAMGIMLRMAKIPARVVLGYMHPPPDKNGNFTVTTFDAHAWVEAYFQGLGWIPFDPTPPDGLTGGRSSDLPWAPHVYPSDDSSTATSEQATPSPSPTSTTSSTAPQSSAPGQAADRHQPASMNPAIWVGLAGIVVLLMLLLVPGTVRSGRRRRRLAAAAHHHDPEALWAELADTATDLGYPWSASRTPRQVSGWLGPQVGRAAQSLDALAEAVERHRYAGGAGTLPDGHRPDSDVLARELGEVTAALRDTRTGRDRTRARFWPASLRWTTALRARIGRPRHRG